MAPFILVMELIGVANGGLEIGGCFFVVAFSYVLNYVFFGLGVRHEGMNLLSDLILRIEKDQAINPLVADPAFLLLVIGLKHSPHSRLVRHIIFMAVISCNHTQLLIGCSKDRLL